MDNTKCGDIMHKAVHEVMITQKAENEKNIAEIERLKMGITSIKTVDISCDRVKEIGLFASVVEKIRAEAIKEFAERLKIEAFLPLGTWCSERVVTEAKIDNLVKEMTGGQSDV